LNVLGRLLAAQPGLSTGDAVRQSQLPARIINLLNGKLSTIDRNQLADYIVHDPPQPKDMDARTWRDIKPALEEIIADPRNPNHQFTYDTVRGQGPWNRAAMAFLGSPEIRITTVQAFMARRVGAGDLVDMWRTAQEARRVAEQRDQNRTAEQQAPLVNALRTIPDREAVAPGFVNIKDGEQRNIYNVGQITSATYGPPVGSSVAEKVGIAGFFKSKVIDVTDRIRLLLSDGVLNLESVDLTDYLDAPGMWWSQSLGGTKRELKIYYRTEHPEPEQMLTRVQSVVSELEEGGFLREMHRNDGEYTWFKLNEWMQVEIVKIFAKSMEHTPWYRFPFMKFMGVYIKALYKECMIVLEKHGAQKAFFSMAFATDAVPAIAMSLLFGQMELMALPLKTNFGEDYTNAADRTEQIVIKTDGPVNWANVDRRIQSNEILPGQGLYTLDVPTFKKMTEVIENIAIRVPLARILQISNNNEVQVRVSVPAIMSPSGVAAENEGVIRQIEALPGVERMFDYKFPTDGDENKPSDTQISLCVKMPYLLSAIRRLQTMSAKVEQIYDWWL